MTLKEFCNVWDFQYPNGIARVEVKNKYFDFVDLDSVIAWKEITFPMW